MAKMTKQLILEGEIFLLDTDLKRGKLKVEKNSIDYTLISPYMSKEYNQIAIITQIDDEGFNYFEYFLGNKIEGRVLFKNCYLSTWDDADLVITQDINNSQKQNIPSTNRNRQS